MNDKKKIAHAFDLDSTDWSANAMWWVVDKECPDKPIIKVSADEGRLIMQGFYKKQNLAIKYNGQDGWLSPGVSDRIQRKRKLPLSQIGLSMREFYTEMDPLSKAHKIAETVKAVKLSPEHDHLIVLLTNFPGDNKALLAELRSELEKLPDGVTITIRLQCNAGRQLTTLTAAASLKHTVEVLELVVGLTVAKDRFVPVEATKCDLVKFYTDDSAMIESLKGANTLFRSFVSRTDATLKDEVRKNLVDSPGVIRIMQFTTNLLNNFASTDIEVFY